MITRPRKIYRIAIYSQNKLDPAKRQTDNSFEINVGEIPEDNSCQYQWALESFVTTVTSLPTSLLFHLTSASQPNSFSTATKGSSFLGMSIRGVSYNRFINFNSIGQPMGDTTWLRSGRVNIQITDINNAIYNDLQWVCTICVWEIPRILV